MSHAPLLVAPVHVVADEANRSAGQALDDPVQVSATSQTPAEARHTAPAFPGVLTQPVTVLHESTVQAFRSSQVSDGTPAWHRSSSAPMSGVDGCRWSASMSTMTAARKTPAFSIVEAAPALSRCRSVSEMKFGATLLEAASLPVAVCQLASVAWSVPPAEEMLTVRPILKLPVTVTNRSLLFDVRLVNVE